MKSQARLYVLFGNVSSGKSTLARKIAEIYSSSYISSDALREELTGDIGGSSGMVWPEMRKRMTAYLEAGTNVVIDSTGMSPKYCEIVDDFKSTYPTLVIELYCDFETWQARESERNDRWNLKNGEKVPFKMPVRAYEDSVDINIEADLRIDTTNMRETMFLTHALGLIALNDPVWLERLKEMGFRS